MRVALFASVSLTAVMGAAPVWAAQVAAANGPSAPVLASDEDQATQLPQIIVVGQARGYRATDTATATKTDTPLIDIPQSVTVITAQQLRDQAMDSLGDVMRYVPGVNVGQGEGNRDQITLRGQNTTADFFIDGVRDDVQYFRPLYNLERVEVLKGPYALIFGRGGGGGIVNRVQKAPLDGADFTEIRAMGDSFGGYGAWLDWNLPLADRTAFRLNAMAEQSESFRDHVDGRRYAINPYFATELSNGWGVGLSYEYVDDERVTDRGVPSYQGRPLEGYDELFFGVPGVNETTLQAHIAKLRLEGDVAPGLRLNATLVGADYDKAYTNVYANGPATSPTGTVPLSAYSDGSARTNWLFQSNLVWEVLGGPIEHRVMAGIEYGRQDSTGQRYNGSLSNATYSLTNPVFPTVAFNTLSRQTESLVETTSIYAQDQIGLGRYFDVIIGVRWDRFDISGTDFMPNPDRAFGRVDEMISPRLGLVWEPSETTSIYTSYSRSFLPRSGEQFASLSVTNQNLEPEEFENLEVGAKWDVRPGLSLTAALFQLRRTNATTPDPANPAVTINVGATQTTGVELGVVGRINESWTVSGGYAWQDAYLDGNETVELSQTPEHSLALWSRHQLTERLGLGVGVTHQSAQWAAIRTSATTTRLPSFTRVDGAVFYTLTPQVDVQLNVENLLDEDYWADAHNNNNLSPGAPRNARVSLTYRF
jgi:catecholate siderophore receptor